LCKQNGFVHTNELHQLTLFDIYRFSGPGKDKNVVLYVDTRSAYYQHIVPLLSTAPTYKTRILDKAYIAVHAVISKPLSLASFLDLILDKEKVAAIQQGQARKISIFLNFSLPAQEPRALSIGLQDFST
jgi:hypothetical protein